MTPHFQRSVVAQLLHHSHCLPTVTPGIAGAGRLEGHAGLGETPLLLLSGDYRPNYRLPLNLDTHGSPVAHIGDKTQSQAVHPVAGAVASVVEALWWAATATRDSATSSATSLAAASVALAAVAFAAAAFPVAAAFVLLTALQCL